MMDKGLIRCDGCGKTREECGPLICDADILCASCIQAIAEKHRAMADKPRDIRKLNELEQYVYNHYTSIRPSHPEDEYRHGTLWFKSGVQSFRVFGDVQFEDQQHAEHTRRLLAIALANMITSGP